MDERHDDLLDETVLRRSLRLEPNERIPRFDPDAIAALARAPLSAPLVAGTLVFIAVLVFVGFALWSFVVSNAPLLATEAIAVTLDLVAAVAALLYPLAQVVTDPAVPLSLLAALAIAIYHEMRTRKEHAHVHAS